MIFRINNCLIDTDTREIRRGDGVASIEPQVLDLLILLVENRHRLVSKPEIMERIWKSRAVSDTALSSRMKSARQAIGDSGASQALIRTIRGRGFRFVAEVSVIGGQTDRVARGGVVDAAVCDAPIRPNEGKNGDTEFGPLANSLEAGEGLDRALPRQPSVAVLPFVALGDEPQQQILADGLTLDLITRLSRMRWLSVIDRGTVFAMRRSPAGARDIGRVLGVRYIARGSARFFGKRLRVSAALTEVSGSAEIWADQFDCSIDDIFAVQDQVSEAIASAVGSEIEYAEQRRALQIPWEKLDAWTAYHRGCWHMYRFTQQDYEEAERFFSLAAKLEPNAPRAFAGLSFVYWQRAFLAISADRDADHHQPTVRERSPCARRPPFDFPSPCLRPSTRR